MESRLIGDLASHHWIDVVQPSRAALEDLARAHGLHHESVQDCMDPIHLPKFERIGPTRFLILRAVDEDEREDADTVQEMTRKVAVFFCERALITIHRAEHPFMTAVREKWKDAPIDEAALAEIAVDVFQGAVSTYAKPIERALDRLERLEIALFESGGVGFDLKSAYVLKRKASVYKRMLRALADLATRAPFGDRASGPRLQSAREDAEASLFFADDLLDGANALLNLHISLSSQRTNEASQRTNEVVRVLTILSMFLLPLNVITGVYGMNFENMPELKHPYGYHAALASMGAVVIGVALWFRTKGWLRGSDLRIATRETPQNVE